MTKKIWQVIFLSLIVVLAFGLRVYKVTEDPPSLNWDEVSIGYNAYSILKTGKDEWSQPWPVHFKSYGEYKLPGQIYASIPAIAIFGLTDFGVRITPVIYGTLTVLLMFFLGRALFSSQSIGLVSALFLAISPWHIQLTRASFESSFSVFWVILGIWLLVKSYKNPKWLIWAMIPFAISVFTYNSARVFSPLFLILILILYRQQIARFKKQVLLAVIIFSVMMLPLIPFFVSTHGTARYKLVSVTDDPGLNPRVNEARGLSSLPSPLPRLIYNKVTFVSMEVAGNYLAHFTPAFLFISGAPHKQHNVQGMGELYLWQAPFLLLGLYFLFKKRHFWAKLLIGWVLLSIVPVSLTDDSIPHALRTLIAAPFYQLIIALGLVESVIYLKTKSVRFIWPAILTVMVIAVASLGLYLQNFYQVYPIKYSRDWQYGYKQVVTYLAEHQSEYDNVVFTNYYGQPYLFTLFYLKYDPASFQTDPNLKRLELTGTFVEVQSFNKYSFVDLSSPGTQFSDLASPNKKTLFIGRPTDFPATVPSLLTVNFLNGAPAFEVVASK